jgi:hypothetical protein
VTAHYRSLTHRLCPQSIPFSTTRFLATDFNIGTITVLGSRDSVIGIATGYGRDDGGVGVRIPVGSRIFSSKSRPDRLWCPPSLLSNRYRGLLFPGSSGRGVKLTTHLQLVPRSRKYGSIYPLTHTPSWRSASLVRHRDNSLCLL